MHAELLHLSDEIDRLRQNLLAEYTIRDLHAFRVHIRRTRSILKQIGSEEAREFRHSWGKLARATNDARDWDVFVMTAEKNLDQAAFESFRSLVDPNLEDAHAQANEMLLSTAWTEHAGKWRNYIESSDFETGSRAQPSELLAGAAQRLKSRLAIAAVASETRAWHKVRIGVKDVRYIAAACQREPGADADLEGIIGECKLVQEQLGMWHDTIVQSRLLDGLPGSEECMQLREVVSESRNQYLQRARELFESSIALNSLFANQV